MTSACVPSTARLAFTLAVLGAVSRIAGTVVPDALVWIALRGIALRGIALVWIALRGVALTRVAPVTMPTALTATLRRIALAGAARALLRALCRVTFALTVLTLPIGVRLAAGHRTRLILTLSTLLLARGRRHLLAGRTACDREAHYRHRQCRDSYDYNH